MMQIVYFAWLRERVGKSRETISTSAATVLDLIEQLRAIDAAYAYAFQDLANVRVAVDQEMAGFDTPLQGVAEVAFFPPMTGG